MHLIFLIVRLWMDHHFIGKRTNVSWTLRGSGLMFDMVNSQPLTKAVKTLVVAQLRAE